MEPPSKFKGCVFVVLGFVVSLSLAYMMKFLITYFEFNIDEAIKVIFVVIICIPFFYGVSILSRAFWPKNQNGTNL